MLVEDVKQCADILETGIHALAVERHHGMGGVANNDGAGGVMIRLAFKTDEWEVRVSAELRNEIHGRDKGCDSGEMAVEEFGDAAPIPLKLKLLIKGTGSKECARKRAILKTSLSLCQLIIACTREHTSLGMAMNIKSLPGQI